MRSVLVILLFLTSLHGVAQRLHLELGSTVGFKDEFFKSPDFDSTSAFSEFHIFDLYGFTRISKRRWGGELGLGFEKAGYYFVRHLDNSTETSFLQLNRLSLDLSGLFYLRKHTASKWDLQAGLRNYVNLTTTMFLPDRYEQQRWALSARITTNYTYKSFLTGLYYEQPLRNAYSFASATAVFGIRLGVIY